MTEQSGKETKAGKLLVTPDELMKAGEGNENNGNSGKLNWKDLYDQETQDEILTEIKKRRQKGEGFGQIFKDVIQPLQESRMYYQLLQNLPNLLNFGSEESMTNGKKGNEEEIPSWARDLIESDKRRTEKEKRDEHQKDIDTAVDKALRAAGVEPGQPKRKSKNQDDDELPDWIKEMQKDNKQMTNWIMKKQKEEEDFRKEQELRAGIMSDIDQTIAERLRPLETRLSQLNPKRESDKGEIAVLKDSIGTLKEVDALLHPPGTGEGNKEKAFGVDDVEKIRQTGMGFVKDGIELYNQAKQDRDQMPSVFDNPPPNRANEPQLGEPEHEEPGIAPDLQKWIDDAGTKDAEEEFIDAYGHKIGSDSSRTGYATVQEVINAAKYAPEIARRSMQSSIDLKAEQDRERHQKGRTTTPEPEPETPEAGKPEAPPEPPKKADTGKKKQQEKESSQPEERENNPPEEENNQQEEKPVTDQYPEFNPGE